MSPRLSFPDQPDLGRRRRRSRRRATRRHKQKLALIIIGLIALVVVVLPAGGAGSAAVMCAVCSTPRGTKANEAPPGDDLAVGGEDERQLPFADVEAPVGLRVDVHRRLLAHGARAIITRYGGSRGVFGSSGAHDT